MRHDKPSSGTPPVMRFPYLDGLHLKGADRRAISIRTQLIAAFLIVSFLIAGYVGIAIHEQVEAAERAALLEARHIGNMVANAAGGDMRNKQQMLQAYAEDMNTLYRRDLLVVDPERNTIAATDKQWHGKVYNGDPDNEVARTLRDGIVRTYIELDGLLPNDEKQLVLPIRVEQGKPDSPIIGAVILEYTQIYAELWAAGQRDAIKIAMSGMVCVLLTALSGVYISTRIARRLGNLETAVSAFAEGRYDTRVAISSHDEIGKIGAAFNQMAAEMQASHGKLIEYGHDLEARVEARTRDLTQANADLTELNKRLSTAQMQLLQSEKMASLGQLAAGVAHEINNPIGFISSNFGTFDKYLKSLFNMLAAYELAEKEIASPQTAAGIREMRERIELDFIREDIFSLLHESKEGVGRVRTIVQDLKDFSRIDNNIQWQPADIHQGIDATLNILHNELKYKADVIREYGALLPVECVQSQLNQVVMNLVVNAAQAIGPERGTITIRTSSTGEHVCIEVVDNGAGIDKENLPHIFDPFFTTKPVGQGTGLGLALSYGIVQRHRGRIEVESEPGKGTTFRVIVPVRQ